MPKPAAKDYGKSYLDKLLAKLPADKRDAVKDALASDDVVEMLGADALRQEDYSRVIQEANKVSTDATIYKRQLDQWFEEKSPMLLKANALEEENARLKAALANAGDGDTNVDTSNFVSKAELANERTQFQNRLGAMQQEQIALAAIMPTIALKHYQTFNEVIDSNDLFNHVRKVGIPLDKGGYDSYVADRMKEKTEAEIAKKIAEAEKRGEERGKMQASAPYPIGSGDAGTLSALFNRDDKAEYGVEAAVRDFHASRAKSAS